MLKIGTINGSLIGIAMKEMVRRAIQRIDAKSLAFEVKAKPDANGKLTDVYTDADTDAQQVYVKLLMECFPGFGIVAEEAHLAIPCRLENMNAYFTVDPLDGTRAFTRSQSHGVGTMIALVIDGEVESAWVGDVNTGEIYGFRPDSLNTHRIKASGKATHLEIDYQRPLSSHRILLQKGPENYSLIVRDLTSSYGGPFKGMEVSGGSIGILMARLWKGEIGAMVLRPGPRTPWDQTPVVGISKRLGFHFLAVDPAIGFPQAETPIRAETYQQDREVLVIHEAHLHQLGEWRRRSRKNQL